jgi:hypothetical protein
VQMAYSGHAKQNDLEHILIGVLRTIEVHISASFTEAGERRCARQSLQPTESPEPRVAPCPSGYPDFATSFLAGSCFPCESIRRSSRLSSAAPVMETLSTFVELFRPLFVPGVVPQERQP